ncbi:DUF4870 domain-containing protein [Halosimplex sp. J119]
MTSTPPASGPELLDERSLGGILVHLLGLFTGFLGPLVVYAASDHAFTRTNARYAINWHLSVSTLALVAFVTFLLGADDLTVGGQTTDLSLLPAPLDAVFGVVGTVLLLVLVAAMFLTFAYVAVATAKAIFGSIWTYPGALDIVG